jgi:hypothetical protein
MKLRIVFVLAVAAPLAMGCTKKSSPEFETSVDDWVKQSCACRESDDPTRCIPEQPRAELSGVEKLMANAGMLTDDRREVLAKASQSISACSIKADAERIKREHARETEALMREAREEDPRLRGAAKARPTQKAR